MLVPQNFVDEFKVLHHNDPDKKYYAFVEKLKKKDVSIDECVESFVAQESQKALIQTLDKYERSALHSHLVYNKRRMDNLSLVVNFPEGTDEKLKKIIRQVGEELDIHSTINVRINQKTNRVKGIVQSNKSDSRVNNIYDLSLNSLFTNGINCKKCTSLLPTQCSCHQRMKNVLRHEMMHIKKNHIYQKIFVSCLADKKSNEEMAIIARSFETEADILPLLYRGRAASHDAYEDFKTIGRNCLLSNLEHEMTFCGPESDHPALLDRFALVAKVMKLKDQEFKYEHPIAEKFHAYTPVIQALYCWLYIAVASVLSIELYHQYRGLYPNYDSPLTMLLKLSLFTAHKKT